MFDYDMEVVFDINIILEDIFKVSFVIVYVFGYGFLKLVYFFKLIKLGIYVYCRLMGLEWLLILF